jgi:hypothetical protein
MDEPMSEGRITVNDHVIVASACERIDILERLNSLH